MNDTVGKQGAEPASEEEPEEKSPSPEAPAGELTGLLEEVNDKAGNDRPGPGPKEGPEEESTPPAPSGRRFPDGIVEYLRVVTSLIEGWRVSRDEILQMLERTLRQRSFGRERRVDYVVRFLKEQNPP